MEMVVTTGAIRRAKLQSNRHHQKPTPTFLHERCRSCRPTSGARALKEIIFYWLETVSIHLLGSNSLNRDGFFDCVMCV